MSRWRRISQLATELGSQLQQTRGVKASTKKLPVVLLKNVDGLGTAGKLLNVNHGYARNYLIPKRLVDYVVSSKRSSRPDRKLQQGDFRQKSDGSADQAAKKESVQHRKQLELLFNKLTSTQLVVKRKTLPDSKALAQEVAVKDIVDAIAKQMRIEVVPELVDVPPSETLKEVGEYRLPLKLIMPSGQRAGLDVTVAST